MAEEVFKNIQILKGVPVDEFMDTMGMFAASLSMNCTDCQTEEHDKLGEVCRRDLAEADRKKNGQDRQYNQ